MYNTIEQINNVSGTLILYYLGYFLWLHLQPMSGWNHEWFVDGTFSLLHDAASSSLLWGRDSFGKPGDPVNPGLPC